MYANEFSRFYLNFFSGTLTTRIVWTLLVEVLVFVATIVLAMVDTSQWPGLFFYLTVGCVAVLNSKQKLQ
jgi:equilibrative nucleoside transporter 1/2/3